MVQLSKGCLIHTDLTSANRTAINILFESNHVRCLCQTDLPGDPDISTTPYEHDRDMT